MRVAKVPVSSPQNVWLGAVWTTLLDVALVAIATLWWIDAAAPPQELYTGQKLKFEFQRTVSRLQEMQSHEYLERPHVP